MQKTKYIYVYYIVPICRHKHIHKDGWISKYIGLLCLSTGHLRALRVINKILLFFHNAKVILTLQRIHSGIIFIFRASNLRSAFFKAISAIIKLPW